MFFFYLLNMLTRYLIFGQTGLLCPESHNLTTNAFNETEYVNFKIKTADQINLGTWIIFAENHTDTNDPNVPTVIYVHGRGSDRGYFHRIGLYKVLRQKYQVVTFDYRGFGDSSCVDPTEDGVVNDTLAVIDWVKQNLKSHKIYVWAHSLGTGIAVEALAKKPDPSLEYLMLESPFDNINDEVHGYKFLVNLNRFPLADRIVTRLVNDSDVKFPSDYYLPQLKCSTLILHAMDDNTIPFSYGKQLLDENINNTHVSMIAFNKDHHYGHLRIFQYPELIQIIS